MGIWSRTSASVMRLRERTARHLRTLINDTSGQGTTEYAILVGVLVVIAIIAIVAFRPQLQSLWDAIKNGMEQLA